MIKINLLPVRASKKKETAVQQITIFCVSLLLVAVVVMCLYLVKRVQVASAQDDIATANTRIMELKKKIGKLEEIKTLKEQVKKKLDVLVQLRKNKTGPAERLAILSDITPEQLWLTGYTENGNDIKLSGIAYTEELIATFMRRLEASAAYTGVELVVSEQLDSGGIKLKKFELTCRLKAPAAPQPDAAPKK
ncbi:MAG: PilN domain-containing protein [Oryzomonas sp.]|uniref:PilN domain-containing protein n=1 Tax=Oryzomonas sp. TaxID=2855186 RepID=UPI002848607B|nr:PilN domain-containing protein [Oryzomonas sp.]MDR3579683.1 PilN domain-containing protein [Oryzomonas sp.]